MIDKFLKLVLIRLGLPEGAAPLYYRDVGLGVCFALSILIAFVLGLEHKFSPVFWACGGIATLCLGLSTKRSALVAGLLLIAAIRFAFAFAISFRFSMLLASVACAVTGFAVASLDKTDYRNDAK